MNSRGSFTHSVGKPSILVGMLFIMLISIVISVFPHQTARADDASDHGDPSDDNASIVVHLEPDAEDASIRAERVSGDSDLFPDGDSPASDIYTSFNRDGDAYVHNSINIAAPCRGATNFVQEFFEFNISASADGVEYTPQRVTVDCNETTGVTLERLDEDAAGTFVLGLKYRNCSEGDTLTPFPNNSNVRVEIEGVDAEPTYRPDGDWGTFTFTGLDEGRYRYQATYLDTEGEGGSTIGYVYEVLGNVTIGDSAVRINRITTGEPASANTDDTPACQFGSDPEEPPPIEDEEVEGKYEQCMANFDFMGNWFVCFIIRFVDDQAENWVSKVDELLSIGGDEYNSDELKKAWSYFRNIASLLLMVIGIVMVIGQGISKD